MRTVAHAAVLPAETDGAAPAPAESWQMVLSAAPRFQPSGTGSTPSSQGKAARGVLAGRANHEQELRRPVAVPTLFRSACVPPVVCRQSTSGSTSDLTSLGARPRARRPRLARRAGPWAQHAGRKGPPPARGWRQQGSAGFVTWRAPLTAVLSGRPPGRHLASTSPPCGCPIGSRRHCPQLPASAPACSSALPPAASFAPSSANTCPPPARPSSPSPCRTFSAPSRSGAAWWSRRLSSCTASHLASSWPTGESQSRLT